MSQSSQLIAPEDAMALLGTITALRAKNRIATSATLLHETLRSARAGCVALFYDENNQPEGYVIWCEITSETLHQIVRDKERPCYQYEWREGPITFVLDAFCQAQHNRLAWLKARRPVAWLNVQEKMRIYGRLS